MSVKPNVTPNWTQATFEEEGLDARLLITETDKKGIIKFASSAYQKMTKYSRKELVGANHNIVRHPFMPEAAFKQMWDIILKGEDWSGLVMNLRKDGKHYFVIVNIYCTDKDGVPLSQNQMLSMEERKDAVKYYYAVRSKPDLETIQKGVVEYKKLREQELRAKRTLRPFEQELLELFETKMKTDKDVINFLIHQ